MERQFDALVPADGTITVSMNWIPEITGEHSIIVDVSDVNPLDNNLVNNVAQCSIIIEEIEIPSEVDLSIYDQDITFSNPTPNRGDTVNIQASVHGDPETYDNSTIITPIFEDDFDDGTISKWRPSHWNPSGVSQVTSAQYYSSPYSWYAQSYSWENTGPWLGKFFDEGYQGIRAETQFYLPAKSQSYESFNIIRLSALEAGFVDTGGDIMTESNILVSLWDDDYSIDIIDVSKNQAGIKETHIIANDIYTLDPNTWHNVVVEVVDYDITVTVDDIVIFNGTRFVNDPIDMLILGDTGGSSGGYGEAYWDDVNIYSIEDEVTTIPGEDATCTVSFYIDDDDVPENLIYQEHDVFVPGGGTTTVSFDWIPEFAGFYDIIVDVTETNPSDYDLTNNDACASIEIIEPASLDVKVYSDKQKYMPGDDDYAEIFVKVKYNGDLITGAMVLAWIIDPSGNNVSIATFEISPGIHKGYYYFTNESLHGTYNIKAIAMKPGCIGGENRDQMDKFWYGSPVLLISNIEANPITIDPIIPENEPPTTPVIEEERFN